MYSVKCQCCTFYKKEHLCSPWCPCRPPRDSELWKQAKAVSSFTPAWDSYRLLWTLGETELWFSSDGCHLTQLIQRLGGRYPISSCPQSPVFPNSGSVSGFYLCTAPKCTLLLCMTLQFRLHCSYQGSGPHHHYRLLGVSCSSPSPSSAIHTAPEFLSQKETWPLTASFSLPTILPTAFSWQTGLYVFPWTWLCSCFRAFALVVPWV